VRQLLHRNVQRFRGGLVFKAHRPRVSLNSRLESNKEEEGRGAERAYRGVRKWPILNDSELGTYEQTRPDSGLGFQVKVL